MLTLFSVTAVIRARRRCFLATMIPIVLVIFSLPSVLHAANGAFALLPRDDSAVPAAWIGASPVPGGIAGTAFAQCGDQPNSFYIISGRNSSLDTTANVWRYDAATDTWNALAPIPVGRRAARAVCYQGFIYVMGGLVNDVPTNDLFVYDLAGNTWSAAALLPRIVWGPATGAFGGKIFMIGGASSNDVAGAVTNRIDIYDIASNTWIGTGTSMPAATVASGYVQIGSFVYVVGGYTNAVPTNSNVTQRYDMATDTWETGPAFTSRRAVFALAASTVALYAAGGDANDGTYFDPTALVERLDLTAWPSGSWADLGDPLPTARMGNSGFCTAVLAGGESWTTGDLFSPPETITGTNEYRGTGEGCAVCPAITLNPPMLSDGTVGVAYNEIISAAGGSSPYTFSVTVGVLPAGLTLDAGTGVISGTPTAEGTFDFTITAMDADGCSGSQAYTVTIVCAAITVSPDTLPDGTVDVAYGQTISAAGGNTPYTFSLTAGALPAGLTLDASTGAMAGAPTAEGTFDFTLTATDLFGCTGSRAYTVHISVSCLFCDDFEDGIVDPNWTYPKPDWAETGGSLVGTPTGKKAVAIATPVFGGCSTCTVQTILQTAGGLGNRIWVLGWYENKANTIELLMKEENNKWILRQRVGGTVVRKAKAPFRIEPNVPYTAKIDFDGANFHLWIDGSEVATLPAQSTPFGTVGFQVKRTTGSFASIEVR